MKQCLKVKRARSKRALTNWGGCCLIAAFNFHWDSLVVQLQLIFFNYIRQFEHAGCRRARKVSIAPLLVACIAIESDSTSRELVKSQSLMYLCTWIFPSSDIAMAILSRALLSWINISGCLDMTLVFICLQFHVVFLSSIEIRVDFFSLSPGMGRQILTAYSTLCLSAALCEFW